MKLKNRQINKKETTDDPNANSPGDKFPQKMGIEFQERTAKIYLLHILKIGLRWYQQQDAKD